MLIKTHGIVLKQRGIGENDRIISILSKEHGVIEACANGAKKTKSQLAAATQILCYSEFCLFKGRKYYTINSVDTIHPFYDLRLDVAKLSLGSYLCDLLGFISPAEENAWVSLQLLLNTLSLLETNKRDGRLLKATFELRALSLAGFMPDLTCCAECGAFSDDIMHFYPLRANMLCNACMIQHNTEFESQQETVNYTIFPPVLSALRHIIYADNDKVFKFKLSGNSLEQLCFVTENYVKFHVDAHFKSLDVYKQLVT